MVTPDTGSPAADCASTATESFAEKGSAFPRSALWALALIALVFVAYWPVLHGEFIWDDALLVGKNPLVVGKLGWRTIWFQTDFPLTSVALWLQWLAWGNDATGYHIVDVALHAIDACLVWVVLARMKVRGAWLAAALFAVHPVGVASAGWISEQKNTLSLLFCLISLWLFLGSERALLYCLSLCALVLALLTKTSVVGLPVILLLMTWWMNHRITPRDVVRTMPYFILALGFGLMTVWFQSHEAFTTAIVQSEDFWGRLAGAGRAIWFYLGKILWPFNLNIIYPHWQIHPRVFAEWLPLVLMAGTIAVCWRFRNGRGRSVLFALGAFVFSLFPMLGFFDMYYLTLSRVSDHFQYVAMIAPLALIAAGLTVALSHLPRLVRHVPAMLLIVGLAVLSFHRARLFAAGETLWRNTLAKNPTAWTAQNNLGCILAQQNRLDDAEDLFAASVRLNPSNPAALCNYGRALLVQGAPVQAEDEIRAALKLKPDSADAHSLLAQTLVTRGKPEEAMMHLRMALRVEANLDNNLKLASLLAKIGHSREAVTQFRKVLAMRPTEVEALNNLAWILATDSDDTVRDGKEAVRYAEQACATTHHAEAVPVGTLAAAYAEAGRYAEAVAAAQKAIDLATADGNMSFAAINRRLLSLYQSLHPYHQEKNGITP